MSLLIPQGFGITIGVMLATDLQVYVLQHGILQIENTDKYTPLHVVLGGVLWAIVVVGWLFYLINVYLPSATSERKKEEQRRKDATTSRVGWLFCLNREEFIPFWMSVEYAPFGRLVQKLGLSHFYNGTRRWDLEYADPSSERRVKATLVIEADEKIDPAMFDSEAEEIRQIELQRMKNAAETGNLHYLYDVERLQWLLKVVVLDPLFYPAPVLVARQ